MTYLQKKKLAFMSTANQVKGFVRSVSGILPLTLEGCVNRESITNYKIYGQSVQDGEPTPNNPIEVESVGEYNESIGKYEIPVTVSGNGKPITTIIYLDEPLRKVGDYADYIDFENGKVVRKVKARILYANDIGAKSSASTEGRNYYFVQFNDAKVGSNIPLLSNIGGGDFNAFNEKKEGIYSNNNKTFFIVFANLTTQGEAREYVANKPVSAYYILETPTEQPISLPTIPTFKGTSIITVSTTIQPSQAEIEYYSNVKE